MTTARRRERCVCGAALAAYVLLAPAPAPAQSLADRLAPLALDPRDTVSPAPDMQCATPAVPMLWAATPFADPARANAAGDMEPLADGRPLRADQSPRFLHPTHEGPFGFTDFLVLGDHATVTFERVDADAEDDHSAETWARTGTDTVAGHLVSVFSPAWDASELHEALRRYSWGVDVPWLYWGRLVVPGGDAGGHDHVNVHLALAPSNVPDSTVIRIDDQVQYASHVVNIRDADFGDSRILGGDTALNLPEITKHFYEHFADEYEVIAVVSQAAQLAGYAGFHQIVRNDIGGIGLGLVDDSATYGSAGVLQAVEGYPPGGWASLETVLHEQGHQYGEYTATWSRVGPAAAAATPGGRSVINRLGHAPDVHTPLLTPGAVTYGAVLRGSVRVGSDGETDTFRIEPTEPLVTYHPLTLYRMGLLPAADLPLAAGVPRPGAVRRGDEQRPGAGHGSLGRQGGGDGQRPDGGRRRPERPRGHRNPPRRRLRLAERAGPAVRDERRELPGAPPGRVVRRHELEPLSELRGGDRRRRRHDDRHPAQVGVRGGLAAAGSVRCAKVGVDALVGIELDEEFGGCLTAGTSVEVSGVLNLDDEDYYAVCFRFRRYGAPSEDRIYQCDELNVDRFTVDVTFPEDEPGGYTMDAFAFWSDDDAQLPLTIYTGAIEVSAERSRRGGARTR